MMSCVERRWLVRQGMCQELAATTQAQVLVFNNSLNTGLE